ncbi:helix-turn-helix transcriptional regulator [Streptomyces sp. SID8499]|uniref:LuxR C-terminal-related transcriptional regulator n=1 Tax=Streptomyces sp. SID8499 TaxID=2706106 RepID=UPI0013C9D895|nr:helix-turn-helix transcriptional regulator [Streptomyces sp. SID8499]
MIRLTQRQRQVLLLAAAGNSNARIASVLGNSAGSVAETLTAAYRRLGASDRTHAVTLAIYHGVISIGDLARIAQPADAQDQETVA